jgi:hypothetical protein
MYILRSIAAVLVSACLFSPSQGKNRSSIPGIDIWVADSNNQLTPKREIH